MKNYLPNKMYKITLVLLLNTITLIAFAQRITITGNISSGKEMLVGASVFEKGTTNATVTDIDGRYYLKADEKGTLVVSYLGYETYEVAINGRATIDIDMQANEESLKEVVVVGYGTQRKSDLSGSVSSVKGSEIQSIATPSVEQALAGKIAGVLVTPSSGSPGAGAVIRIRGTGTLNNNNPFYVVDGMLLDDISFVNPNDVESIEVLKDASATAIYGSRGANGVIIITTKKGSANKKSQIGFSAFYGAQDLLKNIPLTSGQEYVTLRNEAAKNQKLLTPFPNPESITTNTDWQNEVFKKAVPMQNVNLSARGGNDMMTYAISGDYFKQGGILGNGAYQRLTLRVNNAYKLNNFLTIGHNLSIIDTKNTNSPGLIYDAYYAAPIVAPRDSTGKYNDMASTSGVGNPAATLYYNKFNKGNGFRTVGNFYLDINLMKGLTFRSNFGLDAGTSENRNFTPKYFVSPTQNVEKNSLEVTRSKSQNELFENTLSYDNTFGIHHINLLAGVTAQTYKGNTLQGRITELIGDVNNIEANIEDLLFLNAGQGAQSTNEFPDPGWRMFSTLFRMNYTLKEKYLFTATFRRDGSSRFGPNNRYANFPSFALGWRLKEEPFLKEIDLISNLKLRGSWGIIGNDKISASDVINPAVTTRLDAVFGQTEKIYPGATLTRLSNPDIRWEATTQTDLGLEIGLLNNRFTAEIDWYRRVTNDILTILPIPAYIGTPDPPTVNAAQVLNTGFDLNLNWRDKVGKSFGYSIGLIGSSVHNEVLFLGDGKSEIFGGSVGEGGKLGSRTVVGQQIGAFYGYQVAGIYQNAEQLDKLPKRANEVAGKDVFAGDLAYADTDGDGVITTKDRTFIGNPIPSFIYSANIRLDFKGIDFSMQINGVSGNKIMNSKRLARFSTGNFEKTFLNRWTAEGTSNLEPRVTIGGRNYEVSERFLEDGSFTSIRNIQLGYTLPLSISQKIKVQNLRVYVSATNLKMWTNYSGYTPEIVNDSLDVFAVGIDRGAYPVAKTVNVGINATF
jgi:TonB-linked SusC/RagA family outer membrane protein